MDAAPLVEKTDDDEKPRPYTLTLVAPGLAPTDLDITIDDSNVLKVDGENARTGASIERSVRLPRDADGAGARASHVDGILTLTVPKKLAESKLITVNVPSPATMAIDKEAQDAGARAME